MLVTSKKSGGLASIILATAVYLLSSTTAWADSACVSGHHTLVLPCTFDSNVLDLSSPSTLPEFGGGMGGHNTLVEFAGLTMTIEADTADGFAPDKATDSATGISELITTLTFSTVSGLPFIGDLSLQILGPVLTGTGTMSFSGTGGATLSPLTGLAGSTFEEVSFAGTNSITETFDFKLSTGCGAPSTTCTGNAQINGITIGVSTVPEPSSLALLATIVLVALGFTWQRRLV
jgi:hypothetical protein